MLDLIGHRFGKLLVLDYDLNDQRKGTVFKCICECGKEKSILGRQLNQGCHKSCGCSRTPNKTSDHPLYQVWRGMKGRCYYRYNVAYKYYGGAGVIVCDEWKKSFVAFRDWCLANGWKQGMKLDKDIIPQKLMMAARLYSPEMCSIVTHSENMRVSKNVKLNLAEANIIRHSDETASELSKKYGVNKSAIHKIRANQIWV